MNIQRPVSGGEIAYHADFYAWLGEQSAHLRARHADGLDWDNLLEEIEGLGRSEKVEVGSRVSTILVHLLKLEHGLDRHPARGWTETVLEQRDRLRRRLDASPSLKPYFAECVTEEYPNSRRLALASFERYETERADHYRTAIPPDCPYTPEQVLDADYFPDHAA